MSPALAGRFLTTEPLGKPPQCSFSYYQQVVVPGRNSGSLWDNDLLISDCTSKPLGEGPVRLGASCWGLWSENEDRAEEVAQPRGAQEA